MKDWTTLADEASIQKTVEALKANGVDAIVVDSKEKAKEKVLEMLPEGAEVMTMSSETLKTVGLTEADTVKVKLKTMEDAAEKKRRGAAPEWAIGSVHAVTEDGKALIASNTGSQLPAYAYGSEHVIWVVGTQKIVKDLDEGMKRVYEWCLPHEHEKMMKLYSIGSNVSKLLIFNKEIKPGRVTMILVKEKIGV